MAFLQHHTPEQRKRIAIFITAFIGFILVLVLIALYTTRNGVTTKDSATTALGRFYATILQSTQSYFGSGRGIIGK